MYCIRCRHDLRASRSGTCPECGGTFDPADGTTYLAHRSRLGSSRPDRLGRIGWITLALTCMPWVAVAGLALTWGIGWMILGHPPRPNLDDPKTIEGWLFRFWYPTSFLLIFAMGPAAILTLVLLLVQCGRTVYDTRRWRACLKLWIVSLTVLVLGWMVFFSPWIQEIIVWLLD